MKLHHVYKADSQFRLDTAQKVESFYVYSVAVESARIKNIATDNDDPTFYFVQSERE